VKFKKILRDYWNTHYLDDVTGLCCLCGNTGIIDTTNSAISPRGLKVGKKVYCLCPNGRAMNPKE
jgi:hypothetical protein